MRSRQRIVVTGGSGQLGRALRAALEARGIEAAFPTRSDLDLAELPAAECKLHALEPTALIHAAAFTDVVGAERPEARDELVRVNAAAPGVLARVAAERGIPLVHVSTDYVFDGRRREPYREDDPVAPLQEYGRSKLAGEHAVATAYPAAWIARTSTLYGPGPRARPHYVDAVLERARREGWLELVRQPVSSPTYAPDLAAALVELLAQGPGGVVHVVNAGGCSRIELAREALRVAGLAARVAIVEREPAPDGPARPAYSVLDTSRFRALAGWAPRPWGDALADYVRNRIG